MKLLEHWYQTQIKQKQLIFDSAQLCILQQLDIFIEKFNNQSILKSWFVKPNILGYYIYGKVGRGKTMIINELYRVFPSTHKTRMHFHEFMDNIQHQLVALKAHEDPLKKIAKNLKESYKIIFLDEMQVNDIANAMILKNLFNSLFEEKIYLITSSNNKPDNLYLDGLMRERFISAIELIKNKLTILCLDSPNDYRDLHSSINQLFIVNELNPHIKLNKIFTQVTKHDSVENSGNILIQDRQIKFISRSKRIIWLDFSIICGKNRSHLDYLELVKYYEWFIIQDIPQISEKDIVYRFIWLIDILYDHQCKLAINTQVDLDHIYVDEELAQQFARTRSRLQEMQTKEYLNKTNIIKDTPHVTN